MAESFVLNTGARIPSVGLGVWQIQPDAAVNAIYAAVKVRIRIGYILCYALGLYSVDYTLIGQPYVQLFPQKKPYVQLEISVDVASVQTN